ncbi:MAG TPA: DUF4105 domain-containing protein [Albitalea sp.]
MSVVPYRLLRFLGACAVSFCMSAGFHAAQAQAPAPASGAAADPALALASHPQWLRLLHATREGRSEIHSPDFFIAPEGATDPQAELRATLEAMRAPVGADANAHARCRFPARALWLARQHALPAEPLPHAACPRLARWAKVDRLRSVSLLLVSGYFGNPASSFGHALLRFNTEDGLGNDGLVDLGINFGAMVPDGESTVVYVFKGLTGGYQAGFSDKPYYAHDLIYSRTEFRDMWDHELALDDDERLMLVYHLWEIAARKFTYYFLRDNCAYRMAELLAIAREDDLLARSAVWYAPVEMFHRLQEAGRRHGRAWFRSVRFIPSAERVLRHEFEALDARQARAANALIEHGPGEPWAALEPLAPAQRTGVLDTLLAYYDYRLMAEEPNITPATRQAKDAVVRARLQLPPGAPARVSIPTLRSPADGSAPMLGAAGLGHDERDGGFVRVQWAPFSYELTGHNGLADGELVIGDTVAEAGRGGHARLERLDLIRVKKLQAARTRIAGESALSWQVRLGARREAIAGERRLRAGAVGGAGFSMRLADGLTGYAMVDGLLLGNPSSVGAEPQLGLLWHADAWKVWLQTGTRRESAVRHWRPRHQLKATRRLAPDAALRLELGHDRDARAALSLLRYW